MKTLITHFFLLVVFSDITLAAVSKVASTSPWLKVQTSEPALKSDVVVGRPNEAYLSIQLLTGVMNANDGWWTKFIKNNDQVGMVATVSTANGSPQTVFSTLESVQNRSSFQFSTNKTIVRDQPLGKALVGIQLSLVATSDDGVAKMLNGLQSALPTVGISTTDSAIAAVGLGKTVLDALFGKDLLKTGLKTDYEVSAIETGVYAIFASEKSDAYTGIAGDGLKWENSKLTRTSGEALPANCSYLVVRVRHFTRRYQDVTSVLVDDSSDWAKVYQEIRSIIRPIFMGIPKRKLVEAAIRDLENQNEKLGELARKANTLIQVDRSLTKLEKDLISEDGEMMLAHFNREILANKTRLEEQLKNFAEENPFDGIKLAGSEINAQDRAAIETGLWKLSEGAKNFGASSIRPVKREEIEVPDRVLRE